MSSDDAQVRQLARLLHASACFGAGVPELLKLAHGRVDVLTAAIVFALDHQHDPESPTPPAVVLARLRAALSDLA